MIPAGQYVARALHWELGNTGTGKETICVLMEIMEGDQSGRSIRWNGYFTDKSMNRTFKALRACGWKTDDIGVLEGLGDQLVQIVVEHEISQQNGKSYAKVAWINPIATSIKMDHPMDANQRAMFVARMKLYAKQVPVVAGPAVSAHDRATTAKADEEEEPF